MHHTISYHLTRGRLWFTLITAALGVLAAAMAPSASASTAVRAEAAGAVYAPGSRVLAEWAGRR